MRCYTRDPLACVKDLVLSMELPDYEHGPHMGILTRGAPMRTRKKLRHFSIPG
jgi:hypothetical protein